MCEFRTILCLTPQLTFHSKTVLFSSSRIFVFQIAQSACNSIGSTVKYVEQKGEVMSQGAKLNKCRRQTFWKLFLLCNTVAALILLIDLTLPLGVASGVPYILVILLSLKSPRNRCTIVMAIICSGLTIAGFFASPAGGELWKVLCNRALALFAIWVTALMALRQRNQQLELIEEHRKSLEIAKEAEIQEEGIKVLKATMRTVHDIVGNFLNNLNLFHLEIEENKTIQPESVELMNSLITETAQKLKKLGDLETIQEKEMAGGDVGIEYEIPEKE